MSNGNFHANFDKDIYSEFVQIVGKGNVKKTIQEYMLNFISVNNQDYDNIDLRILDNEIIKLRKDISKMQNQLGKKLNLKDKYIQKKEEIERARLISEKKLIEESNKCKKCGKIIRAGQIKHKLYDLKVICNNCFLALSPAEIKRL